MTAEQQHTPHFVSLRTILWSAAAFVLGDAATSALITSSWAATGARATGIASFVFVLHLLAKPAGSQP